MEIRWLGKSAFEIKTAAGTVIADPYPGLFEALGARDPNTIVTVSRLGQRAPEAPNPEKLADRPGEYEMGGLSFRGVATTAGDPSRRTVNTVFVVDAEGMTVCALGQIGVAPDAQTLQLIGQVDVLLVRTEPGGLPVDELAAAVRAIDAKVIVPSGLDASAGTPSASLNAFLKQLGVKAAEAQPRLSLTRANLPQDTKVVILSQRG